MAERSFRNVEVDLDDLADAVVAWLERDGFEVQDFLEGPTVFIQARKENLVTKLSFTGQALNVRLTPLARGFKVDVGPGDWLDKGVGVGVAAVAVRFINPLVGLGAGVATGYGIYQQMRLPERVMDFVESFLDEHGLLGTEPEERKPRRAKERDEAAIDEELEELRRDVGELGATAAASKSTGATAGKFCPKCGQRAYTEAAFCHHCGQDLRARDESHD
jgi:hypothetical protein